MEKDFGFDRDLVEEVVKSTIRELRRNGMLKRYDDVIYYEASTRLFEYYRHPEADEETGEALAKLVEDEFYDILPMFYRDESKYNYIAMKLHCDISTVTRHKKRLALQVAKYLGL